MIGLGVAPRDGAMLETLVKLSHAVVKLRLMIVRGLQTCPRGCGLRSLYFDNVGGVSVSTSLERPLAALKLT